MGASEKTMRKLLLGLLLGFSVIPDVARAADQNPPLYKVAPPPAVSAPALAPVGPHKGIYPFTGSGFYWGLAFGGNTTNLTANPSGNEALGLGSAFGVGAGYRWADSPTTAFAVDGQIMWNAISTSTPNVPIDNDFTALLRAKAIIPLSTLTGVLPGPTPPLPPIPIPGFTAGQNTYGFVGYKIDHNNNTLVLPTWTGRPGFGVGTENQAPSGLVLDIWAGYFLPAQGVSCGAGCSISNGHQYMVGGNLWF